MFIGADYDTAQDGHGIGARFRLDDSTTLAITGTSGARWINFGNLNATSIRQGIPITFIDRISLDNTSHTIDLQYLAESSTDDIWINNASITCFEEPPNTEWAESESESSSGFGTGWKTKTTLTFTPPTAGQYMVMFHASCASEDVAAGGGAFEFRYGSTVVGAYNTDYDAANTDIGRDTSNDSKYIPITAFTLETLPASSQTFDIRYQGQGWADEAIIQRARICAIPIMNNTNIQNENEGTVTLDSGAATWQDILTQTGYLDDGDYLVMAHSFFGCRDNNNGTGIAMKFGADTMDGYMYGETNSDNQDNSNSSIISLGVAGMAAGSKTLELEGATQDTGAGNESDFKLNRIIAVKITAETYSDTYSADASLKRVISDTFTGDANLISTYTETFTGDANLLIIPTVFYYGDSYLLSWQHAKSMTVNIGSVSGGSLQDTWDHNGSRLSVIENVGVTPGMQVDFDFYEVPTSGQQLMVRLIGYYNATTEHNIRFQLYNTNTTGWDNITAQTQDFKKNPTGDYSHTYFLPLDMSDYIDTANYNHVIFRIHHPTIGVSGHEIFINELKFLYGGGNGFDIDANLLKTDISDTFSGDSSLKRVVSNTWLGRAMIMRQYSDIFTADASIVSIVEQTFSSDANLVGEVSNTFSGDASLKDTSQNLFIGNASLLGTESDTFTGDASLQSIESTTFVADCNLERVEISYTIKTTYWQSPSGTGSNNQWTNAPQAYVSDDQYATASQSGLGSKWQSYHHFGFTVPSHATILGVEVALEHYEDTVDTADGRFYVRVVKPDTSYGEKEVTLSTSETTAIYGTISDLWGLSLSPSDINDDNFIIDVGIESYAGKSIAANLDHLEVKVTYSIPNTFTGDAVISKGHWTGDAYLYDSDSKFLYGAWGYGPMYGGIFMGDRYIEDTFTGDANLVGAESNTFVGDANLEKVIAATFSGDASLTGVVSNTFSGDAHFAEIITGSFTCDANLAAVLSNQFTGDSYITYPRFFGDANLAVSVSDTFNGDAALVTLHTATFTGDANLVGLEANTFSADSSLLAVVPATFSGDASLRSVEANTFTGDALIQTLHTAQFSGDSSLLRVVSDTFSSDASLSATVSDTFSGDASLQKDIQNTFTADASLKGVLSNQFNSDAYFDVERTESFAGLSVLESTLQDAGFAGTIDCVSVANAPGWGLTGMEEFGLELGI
jgi:hypothetical protein